MFKTLFVRKFQDRNNDRLDNLKGTQIVAFRIGDAVNLKNLEFYPDERFHADYDPVNQEIRLRIKIQPDEFLAIGDAQGYVTGRKIETVNPEMIKAGVK